MPRMLFTASRQLTDKEFVRTAMNDAWQRIGRPAVDTLIVIHGGARGGDELVDSVAKEAGCIVECYPAANFSSPRERNQHMVNLGADICGAIAQSWASGTGMCARMARRAKIPTVDYGTDTSSKSQRGRIKLLPVEQRQ